MSEKIYASQEWVNENRPDWNQNDSTAPDYVKNKPSLMTQLFLDDEEYLCKTPECTERIGLAEVLERHKRGETFFIEMSWEQDDYTMFGRCILLTFRCDSGYEQAYADFQFDGTGTCFIVNDFNYKA